MKKLIAVLLVALFYLCPANTVLADEVKPGTLESAQQITAKKVEVKKEFIQIIEFSSYTMSPIDSFMDAQQEANDWLALQDPSKIISHSLSMVQDQWQKVTVVITVMFKTEHPVSTREPRKSLKKNPVAP